MNNFIKLTHKHTQRSMYFNADRIDAINPQTDGSIIQTGAMTVEVEETFTEIQNAINKLKNKGEEKHGKASV